MTYELAFVSAADAEKLLEAKSVNIQGRVKGATLLGGSGSGGLAGPFAEPRIYVALEDVQVDGKTWTPSTGDAGGPLGLDGKKSTAPPAKNKKGKKGDGM